MEPSAYVTLKQRVSQAGYDHEIAWAEGVRPVSDSLTFAEEYVWVVLNSGMKNQVAQGIWDRLRPALYAGEPVRSVFRHPGKAAAIEQVWSGRDVYFAGYQAATDKLGYLRGLPWIGPITCFHLAKNYGLDCCKPDRHLVRIAAQHGTDPDTLCSSLAIATGDRVGTVDLVIWRAANLGWI